MAVDAYHPDDIRKDFHRTGIDIESYIEDVKLVLVDVKSSYAGNTGFDPDATIKLWQETCDQVIFDRIYGTSCCRGSYIFTWESGFG